MPRPLPAPLTPIDLETGSSLTIIGNGATIAGSGQQGFDVEAGTVNLQDLTLSGLSAQGGDGGALAGGRR